MQEYPKMLFKAGGPHELHGGRYDTTIVGDAHEESAALAAGWRLNTTDAQAPRIDPGPANETMPTRAELEQQAHALGIKFDGRTNDSKLAEKIAAKLKA